MRRVLKRALETLLGAVLLAALGSAAGCGTKESLIVVTAGPAYVDGYATNLHTLVVSAGGTTQSFHIPEDLTTQSVTVGLYVPSSVVGRNITVTAEATGAVCGPGYSGSTTVNISAAGVTVPANILMDDDPRTCPNGGTTGAGGTGAKGGTTGTGGVGARGGTSGTGGTGGSAGAPDFSRCTEIDHGTTGTCASCTTGSTADVSVYGVAFSPDASTVVTGATDGKVKIWTNTAGTLTPQGTAPLAGTGLGCVAFSPDGSMLAIGRIGGVDLVSTSSWTVIRTLQTAAGEEAYAVGFSPDGAYVFTLAAPTGNNVTGVLFAHAVGSVQALALQSATSVWGMAVAPVNVAGGTPVAVTDGNGNASIFTWTNTFSSPVVQKVTTDGSTAEGAAFSPDASVFAAGGDDGILSLWVYPAAPGAFPDGQVSVSGQTSSSYIGAVAFSPNYGYVVVGGSFFGTLSAYTLADGSQVGTPFDTSYDMLAVAYSPTSDVIVGGELDCGCVVVCPQ
jgi:WD40 repeat protein